MLKIYYFLCSLFLAAISLFLPISLKGQAISIGGEFTNCETDSLMLFGIDGTLLKPLVSIPLNKSEGTSTFDLSFDNLPEGMYVIGNNPPQNPKPILISEGTQMKLTGDCEDIKASTIWQSSINTDWGTIQKKVGLFQTESRRLNQVYYRADSIAQDTLIKSIKENDQKQVSLLDSLRASQPLLAHLIAPYIFVSYINNGDAFDDEIDYFARRYFHHTQLANSVYNRIPTLFQAFKSYAYTLGPQDLSQDLLFQYVDNWLTQISTPSPAHSAALLGLLEGFQNRNIEAFTHYAEQYIQNYSDRNPEYVKNLQFQVASSKTQLKGAPAPEISLPSPDGDTLKLSDFR